MDRRFLTLLAAGVVGVVAVAPALFSEPSAVALGSAPAKATTSSTAADPDADPDDPADSDPDPGANSDPDMDSDTGSDGDSDGDSGRGTATTAPRSGSGPGSGSGSGAPRSSAECDEPLTDRGPAPQVGDPPQTHEAGEAGSVDVERISDTELRIAGASANDGWTDEVRTESGPRVNVRFTRQGESPSLVRFAASMDQKGTSLHIRVTSCG